MSFNLTDPQYNTLMGALDVILEILDPTEDAPAASAKKSAPVKAAPKAAVKSAAKSPAKTVEKSIAEQIDGLDEDEIRKLSSSFRVADLRATLTDDFKMDEDEVDELRGKSALVNALIEQATSEDADDDEDEDEDADEDEDEDADDDEDEDDYSNMSLRELRTAAKEAGYAAAQTKGMDKDALIELLTSEADEDDDEDEGYDPENMSLDELKALAKENSVRVPRGSTKESLTELLFGDDDED